MTGKAGYVLAILAGFCMAGVLFFILLGGWSILAGPFVRLQSASFVIFTALAVSCAMTIWLYRRLGRTFKPNRK